MVLFVFFKIMRYYFILVGFRRNSCVIEFIRRRYVFQYLYFLVRVNEVSFLVSVYIVFIDLDLIEVYVLVKLKFGVMIEFKDLLGRVIEFNYV